MEALGRLVIPAAGIKNPEAGMTRYLMRTPHSEVL